MPNDPEADGLTAGGPSAVIKPLARRVDHSNEMMGRIRHRLKCLNLSGLFLLPGLPDIGLEPETAGFTELCRQCIRRCGLSFLLLPACFGADAIWFAMPVTEVIIFGYAAVMIRRCSLRLSD